MTNKLSSSSALRVALVICILALLYCLAGVLQAEWLSATPNFPRQRADTDLKIWGSGTLLSLVLAGCCGVFLRKKRPN
jgi:hypothetical protein